MGGDGGVYQIATEPPEPPQGAILVRSREPAVADDIGDQNGRNIPGLAPWRASAAIQISTKARPQPPASIWRDSAEGGGLELLAEGRLRVNGRVRSLLRERRLLRNLRLRPKTAFSLWERFGCGHVFGLLARETNLPLALMLVRMALRPISKTRSLWRLPFSSGFRAVPLVHIASPSPRQ
jgi:hypothetical protein